MSPGDADNTNTAVSGTANSLTWVPVFDNTCATQKYANARLRRNGTGLAATPTAGSPITAPYAATRARHPPFKFRAGTGGRVGAGSAGGPDVRVVMASDAAGRVGPGNEDFVGAVPAAVVLTDGAGGQPEAHHAVAPDDATIARCTDLTEDATIAIDRTSRGEVALSTEDRR
jgi:hypothetical protein